MHRLTGRNGEIGWRGVATVCCLAGLLVGCGTSSDNLADDLAEPAGTVVAATTGGPGNIAPVVGPKTKPQSVAWSPPRGSNLAVSVRALPSLTHPGTTFVP